MVGRPDRWQGQASAIGTLIERQTRTVRLLHLPRRHGEALNDALTARLADLPPALRRSITWDQGSEMAGHDQIAELFGDGVFFAHAGKPWQRPTNENSNGLLRQYFPKGSDLRAHSVEDLRRVEERLNSRPRKTLEWATPAQIFATSLASS